ncbi:hypothetical protein P12x_005282 [Tundrisphaera lichenicola]|uniref:hypothetical protein n=1 Tax=Tundrisphaera lichenicola TaxID=2029860 RepID=UPI003EBE4859
MTAEKDALEAALRAIYGEMHPYRNPETMRISDDVLALGVLLRRETEMTLKTRVIEPAYAEGAERQTTARKRARAELAE